MSRIINQSPGTGQASGFRTCCGNHGFTPGEMTRRKFVRVAGTGALGTVALSGLSWSAIAPEQTGTRYQVQRQPLMVKPILTYEVPQRREKTSWRAWGGIQTEQDAAAEVERIEKELKKLNSLADFPVTFLPVSSVRRNQDLNNLPDLDAADLYLVYAAGGSMGMFDTLNNKGKNVLIFCRHQSGPVYLWYEIISPRYLRQHTDKLSVKGIDENDVVIDSPEELLWRLRALCGLKNTVGTRVLAVGGPGAWAQPEGVVPALVRDKYQLDMRTISYDELGNLITEARKDKSLIAAARTRADRYLEDTGVRLETDRKFVDNCFVLEEIFIGLMTKYECRSLTINECMGTIMPLAETTACLTLSLLNDDGYLAFCESDFVVVPAGILMANIAGKPSFLNDPTFPHNNIITLAHCTAPRKMDGKRPEPARIMTHFESDYGAAPKVDMLKGQIVTNIMPDFAFETNVGLLGQIDDNPFLDICRSQIEVKFTCDSRKVAEKMPGFHWITVYGDYIKEAEYAFKKIGIGFDNLT